MKIKVTDELLYKYVPKADQEMLEAVPDRPDPGFETGLRHKKQMQKLLRHSRRPNAHFRYMTTAGRLAVIAILVVAVSVALPAGVKATERFRIWITEKIQRDDYTQEHYAVEGTGGGALLEFTYVPEGYCMTGEENTGETYTGQFENEKGELIVFSQAFLDDGAVVEQDMGFTESHYTYVRQQKILVGVDEEGWRSACWTDRNVYYTIVAQNLSEDKLIRMIEGMKDQS